MPSLQNGIIVHEGRGTLTVTFQVGGSEKSFKIEIDSGTPGFLGTASAEYDDKDVLTGAADIVGTGEITNGKLVMPLSGASGVITISGDLTVASAGLSTSFSQTKSGKWE